ncbi:MAG TPA: YoaK family protein [Polyangiaceae bacterium]
MPTSRTLVLLLGLVAGSVDAIGYVTLFHLFTANMTGNSIDVANGIAAHRLSGSAWHALPISAFLLGAIVGALFASAHRSKALALVAEALALAAFALLASTPRFGELHWLTAAMPALAMGIQAVSFRRAGGGRVQTAFVTGMLVTFADALVAWVKSKRPGAGARARLVLGIWLAYVTGAFAGFAAHARIGATAIVLPFGGLFGALVLIRPSEPSRRLEPSRRSAGSTS